MIRETGRKVICKKTKYENAFPPPAYTTFSAEHYLYQWSALLRNNDILSNDKIIQMCRGYTKAKSSNEGRFLRGRERGAEALRPVGTSTIISNERQLNGMSAVRKMISASWLKV